MATQTITATRRAAAGAVQHSGTPPGSPAQGTDYTLTDLELLGLTEAEEAAAENPERTAGSENAGQQEGTDGAREQGQTSGRQDANAQPQDGEAAEKRIEEFAKAFELPEIGAKLRAVCERERGYREAFPSVEEARAVREVFADVAAARAAAAAQLELARLDGLVESRDPRAHADLLAGLERLAPESIRSLALAFVEQLPVLDPEAYRSVRQRLSAQTGRPAAEPQDTSNSMARNLLESAGEGARHAGPLQGLQESQAAQRPAAAGAEGQAARTRAAEAAAEFLHAVNAEVGQTLNAAVEQRVEELLPDATAGARQKIAGEIFRELDLALRADPELQEQVRDSVRNALLSGAGQTERPGSWRGDAMRSADPSSVRASRSVRATEQRGNVARLIARRAKAALPSVARRVVADWTETVLRTSQARRARQTESASRAEVGRGGAPAPVPAVPKRVDYNRMSDEEILNME